MPTRSVCAPLRASRASLRHAIQPHDDRNAPAHGIVLDRPPDNPTDEELMAALAAGDAEALVPLYARHAGVVFGVVAHSLDRPAAEEVTQDVFVAIWQKAHTYDPSRGHVRPWLLQIARTRVLNELRRRGRRPKLVPDADATQIGAVPDAAPLPDEVVWRDDRRAAVVAAVNALPPPQQQALALAYFADLSQEQVAAALGLPLGTAKSRIRAGMQRLRVSLSPIAAPSAQRDVPPG